MSDKRRPGLAERAARLFDLPGDALAGLPRVELVGNGEVRMENHRGILSYGTQEIHVSGGAFGICICGEGLEVRVMNALELLITGRITEIRIV